MSRYRTTAAFITLLVLGIGAGWVDPPAMAAAQEPLPLLPGPPSAPVLRSVSGGDASVVVRWEAPRDDGGAPRTAYVVTAAPSGRSERVGPEATAVRVRGLRNGEPASFTVTAANAVGSGPASERSRWVTPRKPVRFFVERQPARRTVFGRASTIRVGLRTAAGKAVPGQRVNLLARQQPLARWRRVAAGTTGTAGRVTLRPVLKGTSALRVVHPPSDVAAPALALRSVVVAKRVVARPERVQSRSGRTVVIRGYVAPDQRVGSTVALQRRRDGAWERVAAGRMVTARRFVIRWAPRRVGWYALRVVKAADSRRAAGTSQRWAHRVTPEIAADIARDILRDARITLAEVHLSGGRDGASARNNVVDIARGRRARRSCSWSAPCGRTAVDLRVLRAIRSMGTRGRITVSEIAGGAHSSGSAHYSGDAVDITWVDGSHVSWGSRHGMAVRVCEVHGASQVFAPSRDPYGGHSRHVHCGWS